MNPYDPPTAVVESADDVKNVRIRRGPALYIACCGLLGGLASIPFLATQNPVGFAVVLVGCLGGGLLYRSVSRDWPHDESVRQRQITYSAVALTLLPLFLGMTAGDEGQGLAFAIIGFVVGGSVACGILVSGTRRLNLPANGFPGNTIND